MASEMRSIGKPTPRIDARERVTGQARYTGDVQLPGMLYARVLRSPYPHARIVRIDVSKAKAMPGVHAILTKENCRIQWSSGDSRNKRLLFNDPVRFVGDAVAAVAASDRHTAEEALQQIVMEYEELPFVLDMEQALAPGAPEIHPGGNLSPNNEGERAPETDQRGDVERGFAEADQVFEDVYISKHHNNAQMEPRVSVAQWEGSRLTVWASTQGISNCRRDLAKDLGLPLNQVRVICQYMGGGFGNKNQCHDFDLMASALAKETGRPVKLEFTRAEDFVAVHGRWPTKQYYKVGVKKDGSLTAIQMKAYSGMGPYRKGSGGVAGAQLYRCPNVKTEVYPVYTNMAVSANYRAPSYPQGVFGIESLMDHIAHTLGINPLDFRLKNMTEKYHDEVPYSSYGLRDCVTRGAEALGWRQKWHPPASDRGAQKQGVGMAMGYFGAGLGMSSAVLKLNPDGSLQVHVAVTDIGTAAKTTMGLLGAEAMEIPFERVSVLSGDTDRAPYSVGESGSRTTNYTGYAVVTAAEDLKRQLRELAAQSWSVAADAVQYSQGAVYMQDRPDRRTAIAEILKGNPDGLIAQATTDPKLKGVSRNSFAAHFVELEVDTETGDIRILKYVAAHDSGRILNPLTAGSQVKGGVAQGVSMALREELLYDQMTGIPLNPGYYGARIVTHGDVPDVEVIFVETADPYGPYGAKSVGEPPIVPSVAAIANAVFNATGIRIKELPITRSKILDAAPGVRLEGGRA